MLFQKKKGHKLWEESNQTNFYHNLQKGKKRKQKHLKLHTMSPGKLPKPAKHRTANQRVKATNVKSIFQFLINTYIKRKNDHLLNLKNI